MRLVRSLLVAACVGGLYPGGPSSIAIAAPPAKSPPSGDARARYESATLHYNLGEYADALSDFKEAYRLRPDPAILYNIAQCHRQLGDSEQAARLYRSYLRERPDAKNRADVEKIIAEMDALADKQRTATPSPAPAPSPAAPAPTPEIATAPTPAPVAAPIAATPSVDMTLTTPPPHARPLLKKPWFWAAVVGGAGVVAAAVACGVVFGVKHDPSGSLPPVELH